MQTKDLILDMKKLGAVCSSLYIYVFIFSPAIYLSKQFSDVGYERLLYK